MTSHYYLVAVSKEGPQQDGSARKNIHGATKISGYESLSKESDQALDLNELQNQLRVLREENEVIKGVLKEQGSLPTSTRLMSPTHKSPCKQILFKGEGDVPEEVGTISKALLI
mgnify:CR=1 FL=1